MKVLDKNSDLFKRYSDQLEKQEEEINDLNNQSMKKQNELQEVETKLKDYIAGLDIG
jgi:predicted  nucleic acid-binding Zn-ribbon protein